MCLVWLKGTPTMAVSVSQSARQCVDPENILSLSPPRVFFFFGVVGGGGGGGREEEVRRERRNRGVRRGVAVRPKLFGECSFLLCFLSFKNSI